MHHNYGLNLKLRATPKISLAYHNLSPVIPAPPPPPPPPLLHTHTSGMNETCTKWHMLLGGCVPPLTYISLSQLWCAYDY